MRRTARAAVGGLVYHVLNRGNNRQSIFLKDGDYAAFLRLLIEGRRNAAVDVFGYCLMPNHWHLVVRPRGDRDLAAYLGWVSNTHVKRYRQHYQDAGLGHLYQGRYKSFPVQDDGPLLRVLRYVEGNPLRAGLVDRAERWRWSSLGSSGRAEGAGVLSGWPVERPAPWVEIVNEPQAEAEVLALRAGVNRGRPYGTEQWVAGTARALGLEHTLRDAGRPRMQREPMQPERGKVN